MVAEEHKLLAGIFVRAYRLVLYALAVELADSSREIAHLEREVTQTGFLFVLPNIILAFANNICIIRK